MNVSSQGDRAPPTKRPAIPVVSACRNQASRDLLAVQPVDPSGSNRDPAADLSPGVALELGEGRAPVLIVSSKVIESLAEKRLRCLPGLVAME